MIRSRTCRRFVLLAGALALCSLLGRASAEVPPAASRQPVPDVVLHDANGHLIALDRYRGRVVMLDFWETWCGGCKVEIPWYLDFQKKYRSQGLTVIGVAMDDSGWKTVKPYMTTHPFNYAIAMGDTPSLIHAFGLVSLPKTLLIDRHGRIADAHTGVVDKAAWEREITRLLQEH